MVSPSDRCMYVLIAWELFLNLWLRSVVLARASGALRSESAIARVFVCFLMCEASLGVLLFEKTNIVTCGANMLVSC